MRERERRGEGHLRKERDEQRKRVSWDQKEMRDEKRRRVSKKIER